MSTRPIYVGDKIQVYTQTPFKTGPQAAVPGTVTNPARVVFTIKTPSGVSTSYEYGVDDEVIYKGVGDYYMLLDVDESGRWYTSIRGYDSDGEFMGADEDDFYVNATRTS